MIDSDDASAVAGVLADNLRGIAKNKENFAGLPDSFWGYYARGHDSKGGFGLFVAYSQDEADIDHLIKTYKDWAESRGSKIK